MDEDEDVVFENSPLHQHLLDAGFSAGEVKPEKKPKPPPYQSKEDSNDNDNLGTKIPIVERVKKHLNDYVFDETWRKEVNHMYRKSATQLVEEALKDPGLSEDDAVYVESFAMSLNDGGTSGCGETILGQMLTQVGVLIVTIGYGFFRMFYMKSPDLSTCFFIYALDIMSVIMTMVALLPATIKFAMAGRLVGRMQTFFDAFLVLLQDICAHQRLTTKIAMFIQETEVIHHGYTMVTAPMVRLERGINAGLERQCPDLRRVVFHRARNVLLDVKDATSHLLHLFPKTIELKSLSNCMALYPLEDYGSLVMLKEDQSEELIVATENYSLASIKTMVELTNVHISEFIRVICILCLVESDVVHCSSLSGFSIQFETVQKFLNNLKNNNKPLEKSFILHKALTVKMSNLDARQRSRNIVSTTPVKSLYIAVHSLRLHLESALKRIHTRDEHLEVLSDKDDLDEDLDSEFLSELSADLELIHHDLNAGKDCYEQLSKYLLKITGKIDQEKHVNSTDDGAVEASRDEVGNIPSIPDCDPIPEDQVFEGYTGEEDDRPTSHRPLEASEFESQKDQKEALRMLSELKTVIAVRAKDMQERERVALLKQNPNMPPDCSTDVDRGEEGWPSCINISDQSKESSLEAAKMDRTTNHVQNINKIASDILLCNGTTDGERAGSAFSASVAHMAAAVSRQMAPMSEETFGDSDDDEMIDVDRDNSTTEDDDEDDDLLS